ncbi:hypothetical protein F2Q68_00024334, partial [Brassica cretica]
MIVHGDVDAQKAETEGQEQTSALSTSVGESNKANTASMSESLDQKVVQRRIPPPGDGKKIYDIDPMLKSYDGHLDYRYGQYIKLREEIDKNEGGLEAFSRGYEIFGFTRSATGITYREWAPGAKAASLIGDFNNWNSKADVMTRNEYGVWEIFLPNDADGSPAIPHGSRVKIRMDTPSGIKDSIPAWIKYSVQAPGEIPYNGVYYDPAEESTPLFQDKYVFKHPRPRKPTSLRIYESHVGMSSTKKSDVTFYLQEPMINTYANFRDDVLPRIKKLGYNAVQIMAIQEHSYYASFGYHVTNFFAPSSRFGTPDDLKSLIDKAHELGLVVLMDIVHSHASKNTLDGLNMFDGTDGQYFHSGERGYHWMWDSRLFNYGSWEVLRYLLSNARWWLEEYKFDGFRFDGVTSMMYTHHGLQVEFTGNYNEYFGYSTDVDAVVYLMLVNDMIHGLYPEAIVVGEDVSGMPAFCIPVQDGGVGFDYRLHMAVADKWIELLKKRDEEWQVGDIVFTLTNRRWGEKCVVYAESHDQALVGDKTIAFWLMDKRRIPPPGDGKKIYDIDPMLKSYDGHLDYRYGQYIKLREEIDKNEGGLEAFSRGYEIFGFTRSDTGITYREWAPGAKAASLIGDFNNWNSKADVMTRNEYGVWEIFLPNNADGSPAIPHGSRVKIRMDTPSGIKDSIPAWIKYSVQAPGEIPYDGVYYDPAEEDKYVFKHPRPRKPTSLRIYESHVGMSSTEPMINTYANFRDDVLPRIKKLGYNAVQIMAIQEHSYYASFGYHVTNFFAPSSRFGTPDDLKSLIDKAHELGLVVLMDIVHSHASKNTLDGLNMFDGTDGQYFHSGSRGYHWMWDSRLFNYGSWEVLRYLLSNARWWLEEYKFDGFRFDGVTSMMYTHHGLQVEFTGNYNEYFGYSTDVDAVVYLMLVNDMIHGLYPEAIVVGEDVSGMPAFCIPVQDGGVGFDYRLHMAVADKWIELLKKRDEEWQVGDIVFTLTNRRWGEKCVVYAESHDQALVGDKTIAFWLMDK